MHLARVATPRLTSKLSIMIQDVSVVIAQNCFHWQTTKKIKEIVSKIVDIMKLISIVWQQIKIMMTKHWNLSMYSEPFLGISLKSNFFSSISKIVFMELLEFQYKTQSETQSRVSEEEIVFSEEEILCRKQSWFFSCAFRQTLSQDDCVNLCLM